MSRLEDRLFFIKPKQDEKGKFIPYCNYQRHRGIIIKNKHGDCEKKQCHYYKKLYLR